MRSVIATKLEILRETAEWVAICKPAGLAVIPGRDEEDTVLEALARQLRLPCTGSTDPRLRVVHRLDKETSGVLLWAKNSAAQRFISHQFMNNTVEKQYLALVCGRPEADAGEVDAPLARRVDDPRRMGVVTHGGRPARTAWKVEQRFNRVNMALLRVFPKTGKTHQIRVHLAHIGLPLAIDPLYNKRGPRPPRGEHRIAQRNGIFLSSFKSDYRPNKGAEEFPLIDRLTLHAQILAFKSPDGEEVRLECRPPKDLRAVLNQLAKG